MRISIWASLVRHESDLAQIPAGDVEIVFDLCPPPDCDGPPDALVGEVSVTYWDLTATRKLHLLGGELHGFAERLRRIRQTGTGYATLRDSEPMEVLTVSANPPHVRWLLLRANWDMGLSSDMTLVGDELLHSDDGARPGVWLVFQGLLVPRERLPAIIEQFESLIEETQVSEYTFM